MVTFSVFVCLILACACIDFAMNDRKRRHGHVRAGYPLVLAVVIIAIVGLIALWPVAMSIECSRLRYCGIGLDDTWVLLWIVPAGILYFVSLMLMLAYVISGGWAQDQCCGEVHTPGNLKRYENQQERLASLGYTSEECWAVLREAIAVAAELGEERTRGDVDYYEFTDDRVVITMSGWESTCAVIRYKPDYSRCDEGCRHGEEVLVSIEDSGGSLKVLEAVNSSIPRVSIFRPGDWIAHLQADLSDTVASRVAGRVAAEAVAEEARKRERDSRFAWLEDLEVDGSPRGKCRGTRARS